MFHVSVQYHACVHVFKKQTKAKNLWLQMAVAKVNFLWQWNLYTPTQSYITIDLLTSNTETIGMYLDLITELGMQTH